MNISEKGVTFGVTLTLKNPKSLKLSMVRSKGLEPSRLLGTTTSRLRVCIDYKCVTHVEAALLTPC